MSKRNGLAILAMFSLTVGARGAAAEPDLAVSAGASSSAGPIADVGGFVEGAARVGRGDAWLHARLGRREPVDEAAGDAMLELAAGVSGRRCRGRLCGDLGVELGRLEGDRVAATTLALRGGVELALARRLGLRATLDAHRLVGETMTEAPTGVGATLGVVIRF